MGFSKGNCFGTLWTCSNGKIDKADEMLGYASGNCVACDRSWQHHFLWVLRNLKAVEHDFFKSHCIGFTLWKMNLELHVRRLLLSISLPPAVACFYCFAELVSMLHIPWSRRVGLGQHISSRQSSFKMDPLFSILDCCLHRLIAQAGRIGS